MLKLQTCVKAGSIKEAPLKCGKESSVQVEAGYEERQDKTRRLAEVLGSARSVKAQNPLMLPALRARSQSSYTPAYTGEGGRELSHITASASLGVLAYLTTPLLVTQSSSLVLPAWGKSSLGKAPGSMPRALPGKQLTGAI